MGRNPGHRSCRVTGQRFAVQARNPARAKLLGDAMELHLLGKPADAGDLQVGLAEIVAWLEAEVDHPLSQQDFQQLARPKPAPHALSGDRQKEFLERGMEQQRLGMRPKAERAHGKSIEYVGRLDHDGFAGSQGRDSWPSASSITLAMHWKSRRRAFASRPCHSG